MLQVSTKLKIEIGIAFKLFVMLQIILVGVWGGGWWLVSLAAGHLVSYDETKSSKSESKLPEKIHFMF